MCKQEGNVSLRDISTDFLLTPMWYDCFSSYDFVAKDFVHPSYNLTNVNSTFSEQNTGKRPLPPEIKVGSMVVFSCVRKSKHRRISSPVLLATASSPQCHSGAPLPWLCAEINRVTYVTRTRFYENGRN